MESCNLYSVHNCGQITVHGEYITGDEFTSSALMTIYYYNTSSEHFCGAHVYYARVRFHPARTETLLNFDVIN